MAKNLIMAIVLLLIYGCGQSGSSEKNDGKIHLNIWDSYNNEEHQLFTELISEYEKKHTDMKITVSQIPWVGHEAKYRTSLTVGGAPDIGRIDTGFLAELVKNNAIADLNQFGVENCVSEYVKAAIYSNQYKDKIYGLPDQITGVCLFYNRAIFREKGLDPDAPPATWDEFTEYCVKLTDSEKNIFGFGMDNSLWWSFPFFNTFGARFISEDGKKCLLNSQEAIDALKFKASLYLEKKVEGGAFITGAINPEVGFMNGRYAMILMGPWSVKNFCNANLDFGVAKIPAGPAGSSTNVGGSNMVIFNSSRHKKEAYDLLRYITGAEFQAVWSEKLSQIPTNLMAYDLIDTKDNPVLKTFMEQMKTAAPRPPLISYGRLEELINPEMEAALTGKKTVEDALNAACEKINSEVMTLQ